MKFWKNIFPPRVPLKIFVYYMNYKRWTKWGAAITEKSPKINNGNNVTITHYSETQQTTYLADQICMPKTMMLPFLSWFGSFWRLSAPIFWYVILRRGLYTTYSVVQATMRACITILSSVPWLSMGFKRCCTIMIGRANSHAVPKSSVPISPDGLDVQQRPHGIHLRSAVSCGLQ